MQRSAGPRTDLGIPGPATPEEPVGEHDRLRPLSALLIVKLDAVQSPGRHDRHLGPRRTGPGRYAIVRDEGPVDRPVRPPIVATTITRSKHPCLLESLLLPGGQHRALGIGSRSSSLNPRPRLLRLGIDRGHSPLTFPFLWRYQAQNLVDRHPPESCPLWLRLVHDSVINRDRRGGFEHVLDRLKPTKAFRPSPTSPSPRSDWRRRTAGRNGR